MRQRYLLIISFYAYIILFCVSCKKEYSPKENKDKVIDLKLYSSETNESANFKFPEIYQTYNLFSTKDLSEEDYNKKVRGSKIPKLDTFLIVTESFRFGTFSREIILKDNLNRNLDFYRDSLQMFDDSKNDKLNVLSGFNGDSQILIADLNNNQDYTDDPVLTFKRNEKEAKNYNKPSPTLNFEHQVAFNGSSTLESRNLQIYPDPHHFYTEKLSDDLSKRLAVSFELMDYWKGEFIVEGEKYNFALQGFTKNRLIVAIIKNSLQFSEVDLDYNANFYYNVEDTVKLGKEIFKIKKIEYPTSRMILEKLDLKNFDLKGYRIGSTIENFEVDNLEAQPIRLSKMNQSTDKFILLDFWGTWCQPCLDLTPELKRIYEENKKSMDFISIALDDSVEKVSNYVVKNNMDWPQAFVHRRNREGIIRDLRIKNYPTFILLDKNFEIVYRGSGKEALYSIENLITEKREK